MGQTLDYLDFKPLLDHFVHRVQAVFEDDLVSVILYGSVARGEANTHSDVDVLLILEDQPRSYRTRLETVRPILRELQKHPHWLDLEKRGISPSVSLLILSREEADQNRLLYLDMIEDAYILVDRDGFFEHRLRTLQQRLHELGAKKVREDGTWYWDLKPDLQQGETIIL